MALDPSTIAQGVTTGIATQKAMQATDKTLHTLSGKSEEKPDTQIMIELLEKILKAVAPQEKQNRDDAGVLQPYPNEYFIDPQWFGHSHFCIFFHDVTPVRLMTEGGGITTKNVGPGWVQIDLRGILSTTEAVNSGINHAVIFSYRDDALGASF